MLRVVPHDSGNATEYWLECAVHLQLNAHQTENLKCGCIASEALQHHRKEAVHDGPLLEEFLRFSCLFQELRDSFRRAAHASTKQLLFHAMREVA